MVGRRSRAAVAAACVAWAGGIHAAAPAEQVLPEVTVRAAPQQETPYGPDEGYRAGRSTTGLKTDTLLRETPQAVTIITRERMEDQGAQNLQDALNYAAGVRSDAYGLDSRTDNVRVRGGYPDEYRDGMRRMFGFYTSNTRTEPYTLERIEVLRGPAAMLYGQGTTAGVINMVSKRPLAEAQREIGIQLGNFDRKQIQVDLTGPLTTDGMLLYRLVALGRDSDTQVDYVPDDRKVIAPSITLRVSPMTSITFQGLYQKDHNGSTSQFFPWSGVVLFNPNGRIPTNRFIGEPEMDRYDSRRAEGGWLFEHKFNERWIVRQNFRYARNENDYWTHYADSFTTPTDPYIDPAQRVLNRFNYFENRVNHILTADQHVEGRFDTGPVRHQLLVGFDLTRFRERSKAGGSVPPPIDVYDPVYSGASVPPFFDNPGTKLKQNGVYVQDQLRFGPHWIFVLGVRHDSSTSSMEGAADDKDSATTKRAAVMYAFKSGWAPYVSYSESFTPLAGTNLAGVRWKPMRGEQIEAGLKWEPPGKAFIATAAFYQLDESKRQIPDPANPLDQIQTGETRTRGVELELVGHLLRGLDVAAHYNYTDLDEQLEALPPHQAAVWARQRFAIGDTPGFMAGAGVRWMSEFRDGVGPEIPAITLFDAMLGYDRGPWRYAINVQNLTDKIYVATCLSRGDCWYGTRRTVIATARYRF